MMTFFAIAILLVVSCSSQNISIQEMNDHIERSYVIAYEDGVKNGCAELMDMLNAEPNDVCGKIAAKQMIEVKKIIQEMKREREE
jgi:hypothetical protein